jgi:hypothetical protein
MMACQGHLVAQTPISGDDQEPPIDIESKQEASPLGPLDCTDQSNHAAQII